MVNLSHDFPSLKEFLPYNIDHRSNRGPHSFTTRSPLLDDLPRPANEDLAVDLTINGFLLCLFAVPHSLLARPSVKRFLGEEGRLLKNKPSLYRSFYVLFSSLSLHAMMHWWQPLYVFEEKNTLWHFEPKASQIIPYSLLMSVYAIGGLWTVTSLFALDNFELLGLKQATGLSLSTAAEEVDESTGLVVKYHYALCRHPIMFGFFWLFLVVPSMTTNHAFFSYCCTFYILLAVGVWEEPDLRAKVGPKIYDRYAASVPQYCPFGRIMGCNGERVKVE